MAGCAACKVLCHGRQPACPPARFEPEHPPQGGAAASQHAPASLLVNEHPEAPEEWDVERKADNRRDSEPARGSERCAPLPRSRVRISRGRLPTAAHEPSGFGTGVLAALEDGGAGDQGRLVAFGSLYEALTAGGEVVDDLGRVQAQAVEID